MAETTFDPSRRVEGYTFTYSELTNGGNCWAGSPAVYIRQTDSYQLPEGHDRYPATEEEYERYGSQLPDSIEEEVLNDIEIGCANYQALVAAGVVVEECLTCPLLQG